jgi:hypothetical protein
LNWPEAAGSATLRLCRDLLTLRREDPVLARQDRFTMRASAPSAGMLEIDYGGQRLLLANFGETPANASAGVAEMLLTTGAQPELRSGEVLIPARTLALFSCRTS